MRTQFSVAMALAITAAIAPAQEPGTNPARSAPIATSSPTTSPSTRPASVAMAAPSTAPTTRQAVLGYPPTTTPGDQNTTGQLGKVVVTSQLDEAREQIAPSLGAVSYSIGPNQIQSVPGGESTSFQNVLLRAPGVVGDSFGQEHVRGEHANLTYRVNGVLLPEPLNGFGQELDTRLIDSLTLIDGSLPAQFGFHTAGIVDVIAKSGAALDHNELSLYGGSNDTFEQSVQVGGSSGQWDYFIVASHNHNDLGIENPTDSHQAIHDYSDQEKLFSYIAYRPDDTSRISLLHNGSYANFQIPDTPGLPPAFTLAGAEPQALDSSKIDENQNEQEYYSVLSYQKTAGQLSFQLSGFVRYGQIDFDPDIQRDLIFQGVSSSAYNNVVTGGIQFDSSYIVNDQHTVRTGFITDYTYANLNTTTGVFPVDADGNQTSDTPLFIGDDSHDQATESGVYVQDEWRLTPMLTMNYGLRYDRFDASFDTEDQVSPRINFVCKIDDKTTTHFGYARYFVPPPVQNVTEATIQKFAGTTNEPDNFLADPPKVERSHYFDVGITHQISQPWEVSVDGFYKFSRNLVDLGQFGEALILSPFNYKVGRVYGAEVSTVYKMEGFAFFANSGWVETRAHDIDSQQFQIDNDELNFILDNDVKLDHEAEFAGSAGVSYSWKDDMVYLDFLYATGLRSGFANTGQVGPHYPVNVGYQHIFRLSDRNAIRLRLDVINIFDQKYEIRDGSGIGVGAPQFGQRLGFYGGVTYEF